MPLKSESAAMSEPSQSTITSKVANTTAEMTSLTMSENDVRAKKPHTPYARLRNRTELWRRVCVHAHMCGFECECWKKNTARERSLVRHGNKPPPNKLTEQGDEGRQSLGRSRQHHGAFQIPLAIV